jgi:hypothetical protein
MRLRQTAKKVCNADKHSRDTDKAVQHGNHLWHLRHFDTSSHGNTNHGAWSDTARRKT